MLLAKRPSYRTLIAVAIAAAVLVSALLAKCALGQSRPTALAEATGPAARSQPVPPSVIGMNMGNPNYWSTEWTFNDPIQSTGQLFFGFSPNTPPFVAQTKKDSNGRPIDVASGTRFEMGIQNQNGPQLGGSYACRIAPGWEVKATGNDVLLNQHGSSFTMVVPRKRQDPRIVLQLTAKADHVALSELACTEKASQGLFSPAFLADTRPFGIVRFMDWMRTNGAPKRIWAERPTVNALSQAGDKGVALESMVALCTELACDPWFNMPLDTDENYYRAFATYVRDHLPKDRKIYVELSNEVWNTGFEQARQATQRGQSLYPGRPDQANDFYYADRVRALMAIWSEVFAGQEQRLVRVYASQAAVANRAEVGLTHNDTWKSVDVLAVAPYFGKLIQDFPGTGASRIDAAFAAAEPDVDLAIRNALANKAVAARFKLGFVTYEGGQHYFGYTPDAQADVSTMQHDPRMCELYRTYIGRWTKEVGGPLVLFDSVGSGSFAHKDYTGQPVAEAPKMRAILGLPCRGPVSAHPV